MRIYGGVDAGGTKFSCILGSDPDHILNECTIRTTTPTETLSKVIEFFANAKDPISAIGVGSFGPIELNRTSEFFGHITNTPKPGWQNTDLIGPIGRALKVPVVFDTDTNAAGLGEVKWGNARDLDYVLYLTIGTGIGGGFIIKGKPLHGLLHPEMGHMRVPHDYNEDPFPGTCPFHGDCLEGLASGPAIQKRWGMLGESMPSNHQAWPLETQYIATGLVNLLCALSPQRIILGGGVMKRVELFDAIRVKMREILNQYFDHVLLQDKIAHYVVPAKLGNRAGVVGALALAKDAFEL